MGDSEKNFTSLQEVKRGEKERAVKARGEARKLGRM